MPPWAWLVWGLFGALPSGQDAGLARAVPAWDAGQPPGEDEEVIDNLELLEHLDESRQLDLLLELSS